jgi:hypothetical protein
MKLSTRLKVVATVSSGVISTLTLGSAASGARTLQQVIDAGTAASDATAIKVGDTGVPFMVENPTTGDWEEAYYTITSGTVLTKGTIISSSNAGAAVSFPAGSVNVFNTIPGAWLRKVVTTDDGVAINGLTAFSGTPSDSCVLPIQDPSTGLTYSITVGALKTIFVGSPSQTITVTSPGTQTAGTSFSVSGTYTNGTPTALDWSINGGSTWNAAASPTISGGTFTITGVTVPSANASQTVMVRDHTTLVSGTSASFNVNAAYALTVNTPSAQVVGTPFTVLGGYTNGTPTALDYRFSDDTAGVWTQVSSPTISQGSYSFSITPGTAVGSRTISVRDRNNQTVTATSGTFAVTSPGTQTITVTNPGTQTVGTQYTLSGTWTVTQPTALDYQITDNGGTPSSWTAAASPTINANGTWSFNITPSSASTSRTISVRDHSTLVSGTSTAYVVNAVPATPVLSSPTGVNSGTTTAVGSVSTTSNTGTLYYLFSTNATETSATIKAANLTKSVTASGTQYVYGTGLTASTTYYAHFVHVDSSSQESNVSNSASFATPASDPAPSLSVSSANFSATSSTITASATPNKAGGTLYRLLSSSYSETATTVKSNGVAVANNSASAQSFTFTGLNPITTYYVYFVFVDAAGTTSSITKNIYTTTPSAGTTMASQYALTSSNSGTPTFAAGTMGSGTPNAYCGSVTPRINIRTAQTASAATPNGADIKFVWGKQGNPCPAVFTDSVVAANSGNGNTAAGNTTTVQAGKAYGSWADGSSNLYGTFWPANSLNAYGSAGTYILWVMFSDGSTKAFDDGTGTPVTWVIS